MEDIGRDERKYDEMIRRKRLQNRRNQNDK